MAVNTTPTEVGVVDVVHNREFEVEASIDDVWRRLVDFPSWQGYSVVEHVSGPVGGEGETVSMRKPEDELSWRPKYCRTIKLDPPRQVIWKVQSNNSTPEAWEHDWVATIDYRLERVSGDTTAVRFQVIKEFQIPAADAAKLAEVRRSEDEQQIAVMDEFLPRLAALFKES